MIELFDVSGKQQQIRIISIGKYSRKIMAEILSKGVYIVKITIVGKTEFGKIIIQ